MFELLFILFVVIVISKMENGARPYRDHNDKETQ